MVTEDVGAVLEALGQRYADRRVHHFEVNVASLQDGVCELAGSVLDEATLGVVRETLAGAFAELEVRSEEVRVLRQPSPQLLTVATNLTNLKGGPSGSSETLSQVVAGQTVERLREKEGWVFVRQEDGYLGWLAARTLTEALPRAATHLVAAPVAMIYAEPGATLDSEAAEAAIVSRLVAGTAVAVEEVRGAWGHVTLSGFKRGWLALGALRACEALPAGGRARRAQMVEDALHYVGVPYLWGGVSALGIDCSGYVQLLYRLSGVTIPRDADMQLRAGNPVEAPFAAGDLLFFGSGQGHRRITHVGMSLGGWRMIHSSGPRNGVYVDDVQEAGWLRDIFVGACSFLNDGD